MGAIYTETIYICPEELARMEEILSIEEGHLENYDSDEVIATYTAYFANGFLADIKVCNGDTPYVDNILFAPCETGFFNEVCVPEIAESLTGEYYFDYDGDEYIVHVKPKEG